MNTAATVLSDEVPACEVETRIHNSMPHVGREGAKPSPAGTVIAYAPPRQARVHLRPSAHWADRWITITKP